MNWEAIGAIGEVGGAIAVVLSLLYLAVQIRQNSLLIRSSTYHAANQWNLAAMSAAVQSPQTAKVFTQGLADPRQLEEHERTQFTMMMHLLFAGFGHQYISYRGGAILEDQWRNVERIIRWYLKLPGTQTWLRGAKELLPPEFVVYLEDELASKSTPST